MQCVDTNPDLSTLRSNNPSKQQTTPNGQPQPLLVNAKKDPIQLKLNSAIALRHEIKPNTDQNDETLPLFWNI